MAQLLEKIVRWGSGALEINQSTLSGAIDIIVIRQPDGTLSSTPFHVRFGKLQLLRSKEKIVTISVNGAETEIFMKLGKAGEAFFVLDAAEDEGLPADSNWVTSPFESPSHSPIRDLLSKEDDIQVQLEEEIVKAHTDDSNKVVQETDQSVIDQTEDSQSKENKLERIKKDKGWTWWSWNWGGLPEKKRVATKPDTGLSELKEESISENDDKSRNSSFTSVSIILFNSENNSSDKSIIKIPKSLISLPVDPDKPCFFSKSFKEFFLEIIKSGGSSIDIASIADKDLKDEIYHQIASRANSSDLVRVSVIVRENGELNLIVYAEESAASESRASLNNDIDVSYPSRPNITLSLCGNSLVANDSESNLEAFNEHILSFQDYVSNPALLFNPDLIIRYNEMYYPSDVGIPLLISSLVFQRSLEDQDLINLSNSPKIEHLYRLQSSSITKTANLNHLFSFHPEEALEKLQILQDNGSLYDSDMEIKTLESHTDADVSDDERFFIDRSKPLSRRRLKSRSSGPFRKSLRPSAEMLDALNLEPGINLISFTVHSLLQGMQTVSAFIYLWDSNIKVVVSDVDGTITRSDMLGNILPLVGKDWSHSGVTTLFNNIYKNGYEIIYLTSRAIGQANVTRDFLHSVSQESVMLPQGPIIMSPDGLIPSFKREVIDRRPQDFKIPALLDFKNLFPDGYNPFFAGFGNRETDFVAYQSVGVPLSKIFIINPKGRIQHVNRTLKKSYPMLNEMVNQMFPPIFKDDQIIAPIDSEYSDFLFWKQELPPISIEIDEKALQKERATPAVLSNAIVVDEALDVEPLPEAINAVTDIDASELGSADNV